VLTVLLLLVQADGWRTTPPSPTVGDTVWVERVVSLPLGWRVRPARLEDGRDVQPLGEPEMTRVAGGWQLRYPVTAWAPGAQTLVLPALWRLGPDGRADSLPGGAVAFTVQSVLPDTVAVPAPRPALAPLRETHRDPWVAAAGAGLSVALLLGALRWRRRPPRPAAAGRRWRPPPPVPDARWLAAGEPRAAAARAHGRLRVALARALPAAGLALGTAECLATVERERPELRGELGDLLTALDRVAFAAVHGADVADLAARARALAAGLTP